jgi:hypothetical protein
MTRFIAVREQFHSNMLGLYIQRGSWLTDQRVRRLAGGALPRSTDGQEALQRAATILGLQVRAQAYTLATSDGFVLIVWVVIAYLFLMPFLRPGKITFNDLSKMQWIEHRYDRSGASSSSALTLDSSRLVRERRERGYYSHRAFTTCAVSSLGKAEELDERLHALCLGDMSIVLGSGGSKSKAFSIHGVTCGDACRWPLVDPCHLREMPLTVLVDREGRIAISHAGVVDPLVFEADINAILAE